MPGIGLSGGGGAARRKPKFTVNPALTGGNQIGDLLTSTTGTATGAVSYARLWFRDGASLGVTTATYVTVAAGVHRVRIAATNAGGKVNYRWSNPLTTFLNSGAFSAAFDASFNVA